MPAIKHTRITIRQPSALTARIKHAAALRGLTVTSFVNESLESAADKIVNQVRTRELTTRDSRAVLAMLSTPRRPNAAIRKAARRYLKRTRG